MADEHEPPGGEDPKKLAAWLLDQTGAVTKEKMVMSELGQHSAQSPTLVQKDEAEPGGRGRAKAQEQDEHLDSIRVGSSGQGTPQAAQKAAGAVEQSTDLEAKVAKWRGQQKMKATKGQEKTAEAKPAVSPGAGQVRANASAALDKAATDLKKADVKDREGEGRVAGPTPPKPRTPEGPRR